MRGWHMRLLCTAMKMRALVCARGGARAKIEKTAFLERGAEKMAAVSPALRQHCDGSGPCR